MRSATDSLGQVHTDYSSYPTPSGVPATFEDLVVWKLMELENNDSIYDSHIHAVPYRGGFTATLGYGLDIEHYGTWDQVRQLIVFGLGGAEDLTETQEAGLELLNQYLEGTTGWSARDLADMANGEASTSWTADQAAAIESISFTRTQGETVLRAILFGNAEAGVSAARSYLGNVRNIITTQYQISGAYPESTELASMLIMRYRGDFSGFGNPNLFTDPAYATTGARRAEFWWRIVKKIDPEVLNGVRSRLQLNAEMFGLLPADASATNTRVVLEAMSHLFRNRLQEGLSGVSGDGLVKQIFEAGLAEGIALLGDTYAPEGDGFDVVQLAKEEGETLDVLPDATAANRLRNLMVGSKDNADTLNGGVQADYLWGRGGDDTLNGSAGDDYLYGGDGADILHGGDDADTLKGDGNDDQLFGEGGVDHLHGGEGSDTLRGGDDVDYLYGGEQGDQLLGGQGEDWYFADDQDTITDDGGDGHVLLNNRVLGGGSRTEDDPENTYYGGGNTYVWDGATLTINGGLVINGFDNGELHINLTTKDDDDDDDDEGPDTDEAEHRTSPIVLDLDGDGIETLQLGASYFDLDADGLSERSGWVSPDDGLLVHDSDGDGRIGSGAELFGNNSVLSNGQLAEHGFQALAEYDSNGDGLVDAQDAGYASLQVWRDLNGNGLSDVGELQSLADAGVVSISTAYAASAEVDANGHEHRQVATVMLSNGTASTAADVWFRVDTTHRINSGAIELTPEVLSLANAKGFGTVQDLWQAMVLDPGLKDLLSQYVAAPDAASRDALLDDLIYRWAGAADVDPYSRDPTKIYGHVMDARQLVTLEHLVGRPYLGTWCWGERDPNPHGQAAPLLIVEYLEFKRFTAAQILAQTEYAAELDIIKSMFGSDTERMVVDWDALQGKLETLFTTGQAGRITEVIGVLNDLGTYSPSYRAERDAAYQAIAAANIDLAPFFDFSTRIGTTESDTLSGVSAGTIFYGLEGDDRLYGQSGGDTYHFARGHGNDVILDREGLDQIVFGTGITQADLVMTRNATTVWIAVKNADGSDAGSLRIDNFFDFDGTVDFGAVELIHFADGTSLDQQQILAILTASSLTPNDDLVFGTAQGDVVDALSGNDNIHGLGGDDQLSGSGGDDVLIGDDGNDTTRPSLNSRRFGPRTISWWRRPDARRAA